MERWLKSGSLKRERADNEKKCSNEASCSKSKETSAKIRKYDPNYLSFGFTCPDESDDIPTAQCVLCFKILNNSSLVPAKLQRHLEAHHSDSKDKPLAFFKRKYDELKKSKHSIVSQTNSGVNAMSCVASYKVSYRIAQLGEAHTIAENLIKPCVKDIVSTMLGEKQYAIINNVPLSNSTISRRIQDMSSDVELETIRRIKASALFSLQLDETCDVAHLAVLLVYVRYIYNDAAEEGMLFCKPLKTHTTGEDIFTLVDSYLQEKELSWEQCVDICTDGAKSMVGIRRGFIARVKAVAPQIGSSHCVIHRHALVVKRIPQTLKSVIDEAVKIVNLIKSRPLNARLFSALCEDMGSQFSSLLLHTEVRWLSRGKVLVRLFLLRSEVLVFFSDCSFSDFSLTSKLTDVTWLQHLAYLADIFSRLNELNLSLQGSSINVLSAQDKIDSILKKLEFWETCINKNVTDCFPTLHNFISESGTPLNATLSLDIAGHLHSLRKTFREYFPNREDDVRWLRDPFTASQTQFTTTLPVKECEQLIDIASDQNLKNNFKNLTLIEFWARLKEEYPEISNRAVRKLLPFPSTYLCELGFSRYSSTKTVHRSRLDAEPDMRLQLSHIEPDFQKLSSAKQAHPSH